MAEPKEFIVTLDGEEFTERELFVRYPSFPIDSYKLMKNSWKQGIQTNALFEEVQKFKPGGFDFNPHLQIRGIVQNTIQAITEMGNSELIPTPSELMEIWLMWLYFDGPDQRWKIPAEWSDYSWLDEKKDDSNGKG